MKYNTKILIGSILTLIALLAYPFWKLLLYMVENHTDFLMTAIIVSVVSVVYLFFYQMYQEYKDYKIINKD